MIWIVIVLLFLFDVFLFLCCGFLYNRLVTAAKVILILAKANEEFDKRLKNYESPGAPSQPGLQ